MVKSVPCRKTSENEYLPRVKEMVSNGEDIMESSRTQGKTLVSALTGISKRFLDELSLHFSRVQATGSFVAVLVGHETQSLLLNPHCPDVVFI